MDHIADVNHRELFLYSRLYEFPPYIKEAAVAELTVKRSDLSANAFADVRSRFFPTHTKAATWLSWVFFLEKAAEIHSKLRPFIQDRLTKQAAFWGISGDVETVKAKHASLHADTLGSLPDSAFAIVFASTDGRKERHYPLRNGKEVQAAAQWLCDYRDCLPFRDRHVVAAKILEKAAEFAALLAEPVRIELEKQAGHGVYDPKAAGQQIRRRVAMALTHAGRALGDRMLKMAEMVESNPFLALEPSASLAACETLDLFDRTAGLTERYDVIPRPEDVFFGAPTATMGEFVKSACELVTGSVFTKDQFSKLAVEDLRAVFGNAFVEDVTSGLRVDPDKMATVASTLPRPDAETLERLMSEVSQCAVLKRASFEGLTSKELADLAQVRHFIQSLPAPASEGAA